MPVGASGVEEELEVKVRRYFVGCAHARRRRAFTQPTVPQSASNAINHARVAALTASKRIAREGIHNWGGVSTIASV
jgi:hypothetical protein